MATPERKTGLGALPAGLLRSTMPPEPAFAPEPPAEDAADAGDARAGGAAPAEAKATRARTKRPAVVSESRGRKLHLPDDVHDRLWLTARSRRKSVSAVAAEILDRNLPRFKVERES